MNLLQKLFGKESNEESKNILEKNLPPENLFATDETPQQPEDELRSRKLSKLELLMKRNFEPEGYKDGYEEHDLDTMNLQINSISAEFKRAIREDIDATMAEIHKIQPSLNEKVKELMPDQHRRLESRFDTLQLKKIELEAEMDLAMQEEGYCEMAMKDYRLGFAKGFRFWSDETHFSTNL